MRERFEIKFDDFTNLVVYKWHNPEIKKIGCVQIAHGINEHVLRYEKLIEYLNSHGITVIAADHYHQGESLNDKKDKLIVKDYDFMDSILKSIQLVREEFDYEFTGYTCLFAHSMGAIATQTYIQKIPDDFRKIILSGADVGTFKYNFLKLLTKKSFKNKDYYTTTKLVRKLTLESFNRKFDKNHICSWITSDIESLKNYENDPLCGGEIPNMDYYSLSNAIMKSYQTKNLEKINKDLKILLVSGTEDPVSNFTKSTKKLYKKYKKVGLNVSMKLYDNKRHEIHNEANTEDYFRDILRFIVK